MRGGIAQYLALLYRALEPTAEVLYFSLRRQYPGLLFPGRSQTDDSVEPLVVPCEPTLDVLAPWQWPSAARRVARWRPEILVYKWWLPFFGPAYAPVLGAARRAGAAAVMIADNLVPHERRPFDDLFTRLVTSRTDAYLVMSEAVERDLARLVPGALVRRVPHPIYSQYASELSQGEARRRLGVAGDVLLFFGFVRRYKGLDTLIEALPRILAGRPVTLIVAGEFYESPDPYRERLRALGIEGSVRLLDRYLLDEEVRTLFAAADVAVLPYRSATQSGVIPVAYAAGCPVITTRVGGLAEVVDEGASGHVVPAEDAAALAEAVLRFFARGGRAAYAEGVRRAAGRYSWETLAKAVLELGRQARARRGAAT